MSDLTHKTRNALPDSAFAIPEARAYPIHDEAHARLALSMAHYHPEWAARIRAAVKARYGIG